ncbi:MAG: T9SS type A sorting domain-containing protein [Saprospiraceae bacterium]|nr:T9SS type A sorting domain-containing protein [Saprospiraceae bacterium]MCF8250310.1 T9SS type A sorting domain-containing protein [Saprospiraceae bacterium]MCF8280965.1 T9SS type A sorting domain-containing protein [Bacteroidales bacterium]MCF8312058.1 T9SS type A sorting domain-containing protein [Saprospiraceae bacterium]MCF8440465.1 T9SS type A sorting domain-containing protein [Saprospiraceae bacterium]
MKNTIFYELARNLAKTFSFLFFSFLFLGRVEAQPPTNCSYYSDLKFNNSDDPNYQNCLIQKRRFYFTYPNFPPGPSPFQANELVILVTLTGNGVFDPVSNAGQYPIGPTNGPAVQVTPTQLYWVVQCNPTDPNATHSIPTGDENNPFFDAFVIVDEGATVTITATVTARINQPLSSGCLTECNITGSLAQFNSQNNTCSNLSAKFTSPSLTPVNGTFTADPHAEVPIYLDLTNTGTSTITLSDLDLKVKLTDFYNTLPDVTDWDNYFAESTVPTNTPASESHDGDFHYFHFGTITGNGVILPGATLSILAFSIKPPEGLDNILGRADINVEYLRVSDNGGSCCALTPPACAVLFPGILPCSGDPTVSFSLKQVISGLGNCQSAFDIVARVLDASNMPTSVQLSDLDINLFTTQTGNLSIISVAPAPGLVEDYYCPPGIGSCEVTIFKTNPGIPFTLADGATIGRVIYQGDNGTKLQSIDVKTASIKDYNTSIECVPVVDEASAGQFLPLQNNCTYCQDARISLVGPTLPVSDCGTGYAVRAIKTTGQAPWKKLIVKLSMQNPNNLGFSVVPNSTFDSPFAPNQCTVVVPAGATPITTASGVIGYTMGNVIYFEYCAPQLNNIPSSPILFDVSAAGSGCLSNVQFEMETEFELWNGQGPCPPTNISTSYPGIYCTPCMNFAVGGSIDNEEDAGIDVPVELVGSTYNSGIFIRGSEAGSSCGTTLSGPCDHVVPTEGLGSCTGDYILNFSNANCSNVNNFSIKPYKDINPLNGVSTFDLVNISKHILGVTPLGSPYKIIAADATKSNSVTTFDLVEIRKLILFINLEFTDNTSWRFVDKGFVFPNPLNPFETTFPECVTLNFSAGNPSQTADFVAIKVGDVNNSHACDFFTGNQSEERGQAKVNLLYVPNKTSMGKGEDIVVDFYLDSPADLAAWQAGLRFDPAQLEFLEVLPSDLDGMNIGNFGLTEAKDGKLRALWYERHAETVPFKGNAPVFSLRFKANRDLRDMAGLFSLDDAVLFGAAYESDGRANSLNLEYKANAAGLSGLPLADILSVTTAPNPFRDELRLTVALKEAAYVDVAIYDAQGRVVATWNEHTEPGQREIVFNKTSRWGLGVFTWQVKTDKQAQSGKVVRE